MLSTNTIKIAFDSILGEATICLFIGDSHARHFCGHNKGTVGQVIRVTSCEYLIWIGSKLMYSVATNGVDEDIRKVINSIGWLGKRLILLWFLGEIDIRVYGVKYYLNNEGALEQMLRRYLHFLEGNFSRHIIVVAVPTVPSSFGAGDGDFPTNGSLEERCCVFMAMKTILEKLAGEYSIALFDQNKLNKDMYLTRNVSADGCHYMPGYNAKLLNLWRNEELIKFSHEKLT